MATDDGRKTNSPWPSSFSAGIRATWQASVVAGSSLPCPNTTGRRSKITYTGTSLLEEREALSLRDSDHSSDNFQETDRSGDSDSSRFSLRGQPRHRGCGPSRGGWRRHAHHPPQAAGGGNAILNRTAFSSSAAGPYLFTVLDPATPDFKKWPRSSSIGPIRSYVHESPSPSAGSQETSLKSGVRPANRFDLSPTTTSPSQIDRICKAEIDHGGH